MARLSILLASLAFTSFCSAVPAVVPVFNSLESPAQQLSPSPYQFGFEFGDGLGMNQYRQEVADGTGAVRGSYGYLDPLGVRRVVDYTADDDGYKAVIRSNEPGTANGNSANAVFVVQPPPPAAVAQGIRPLLPKILV